MSTSANGAQPSATLKRRLSTPLDNGSTPKRVKTEEEDVSMDYIGSENLRSGRRTSPSGKDKRKRRHKKKKKLSIVKQEPTAASRVEPGPLGVSEKRVAFSPPRSNATPGPSRANRSSTPAPQMNISATQDDESTPSKDKGKGRAVSPEHPALQSDAASLTAHRSLLGNILPSLTCQICLQLMYRPFSVVPCGHVACHSCLVNWFSNDPGALGQAPPPIVAPHAPDDAPDQAPQAGPGPQTHVPVVRRKKTCPHCRAVVRSKPVEAWSIKEMVASVVRSGLADPDAVPLELQEGGVESSADAAVDPWKHIFTSADGEGQNYDHLMQEMNMGIRDDHDGGVYRCIDCLHEIWDGHCSSCGRFYVGHRIGMDSDSEGDDLPPIWDDGDDDDDDADDHIDLFRRVLGMAMRRSYPGAQIDEPSEYNSDDSSSRGLSPVYSPLLAPGSPQQYATAGAFHWSDAEEEDEGDYESSFIDDDEDHTGDVVEISSDDDEDDAHNSGLYSYHPGGGGPRGGNRHIIISDSENEDEGDDDDLADAVANREYELYGDDGSLPSRRLRDNPDLVDLTDEEEDDAW